VIETLIDRGEDVNSEEIVVAMQELIKPEQCKDVSIRELVERIVVEYDIKISPPKWVKCSPKTHTSPRATSPKANSPKANSPKPISPNTVSPPTSPRSTSPGSTDQISPRVISSPRSISPNKAKRFISPYRSRSTNNATSANNEEPGT